MIIFFQVEDLFKKHFGATELEKIVSETESSNKMTIDELKEKMEDPVYGDRLVAINVMQLINEFRGYAKGKQ